MFGSITYVLIYSNIFSTYEIILYISHFSMKIVQETNNKAWSGSVCRFMDMTYFCGAAESNNDINVPNQSLFSNYI